MERLNAEDVRDIPFLDALSEDALRLLLSGATTRSFSRGTTVCLQDDNAKTIKVLLSGWLKLYRVSPGGREAMLETLRAGQSFDEMAALQQSRSLASAEAISDCVVLFLPVPSAQHSEACRQEVYNAAISAASEHLDRMATHIETLKVQTGLQRLSEFLIDLCGSDAGEDNLVLPYGKMVLAGKLGMKPESLSRAFNRLRDVGVDSELRKVRIKDVSALRTFADDIAACG